MAVDMKIEVFSVDLFRILWYELGATKSVFPRLKNYDEVTTLSTCSEAVCHAILCRRSFFTTLFWGDIYFDYDKFSKSGMDFYFYLQNNMYKFLPYDEMNIFDKICMSCVVVVEMASLCILNNNKMYIYNAPLCWSMYFDTEYKEEFYANGGWKEFETHAESYTARVLTSHGKEDNIWTARCAFNDAMNIEYFYDLSIRVFREKILTSKGSCPQCLPLFDVVRILCGMSDERVNEFKLTEGFLQLILHMLTEEELKNVDDDFLDDPDFKEFTKILSLGYVVLKAKNEGKLEELVQGRNISFEKCSEFLDEYRLQNTYTFCARLFASNQSSNSINQCMFCGCNINKSPKAMKTISDYHVERIKSVMYGTEINVGLKDALAKGVFEVNGSSFKEKDDDTNEALKLFFALGAEPLISNILSNLRKNNENQCNENDSNVEIQNQKAPEKEIKGNTRKKKKGKNKNDKV